MCAWHVSQGIKVMSALDVPIYITETGIADAKGDKRPIWLHTYIPQVAHAVLCFPTVVALPVLHECVVFPHICLAVSEPCFSVPKVLLMPANWMVAGRAD
jgi:hypothetical protein